MRKSEAGRHHSDNSVRPRIQQQFFPEHVTVGAEARSPERVTYDHGSLMARLHIGTIHSAADGRGNTEHAKKISGDARSADAERRITQRSVQPAGSEHRHVGKGVALLLPCEEITV